MSNHDRNDTRNNKLQTLATENLPAVTSSAISDLEIQKTLDSLSAEDKAKLQGNSFGKLVFDIQDNRIRRNQYLEKLRMACNAELEHFKQQVEIRLKSSERISKAVYEEMILRARIIRESLFNALTGEAQNKFQEAINQATTGYEEALANCKPPDHSNELVNNARKLQINNATIIFERGVDTLMTRMESFYEEWGNPEEGRKILSLDK